MADASRPFSYLKKTININKKKGKHKQDSPTSAISRSKVRVEFELSREFLLKRLVQPNSPQLYRTYDKLGVHAFRASLHSAELRVSHSLQSSGVCLQMTVEVDHCHLTQH